jgi:hypothetical protein
MRAVLVVFVLHFLVCSEFFSFFVLMDDEAVTVLGAQRLLQGEWPYLDWDTRHTPGSYFVSAAFFALFGSDAPWPRVLFALFSSLTAGYLQAISQRLCKGPVQYLPAALFTALSPGMWPILSYHWLGMNSLVAVLLALLHYRKMPSSRRAAWAGAAAAASVWMFQSSGATSLLLLPLAVGRAHWAPLLGGLSLASLLLWAPLLGHIPAILQANVLSMRHHLDFNYHPYSLHYIWSDWSFLPSYASAQNKLMWLVLVQETLSLSLVYLTIYPVALMALWKNRSDPLGRLPGLALLIWLLVTHRQQSSLYACFGLPLWSLALAQLWPSRRAWVGSLMALLLAGWVGNRWLRSQTFVYPIATRVGSYWSNSPELAARMQRISEWMRAIPPGTPIFAYPFRTSLYTLYGLRNAIPYPALQPVNYGEAEHQRSFQALAQSLPEWYILDERVAPLGPEGGFAHRTGLEWDRRLAQLKVGMEKVDSLDSTGLYRRRGGAPPPPANSQARGR